MRTIVNVQTGEVVIDETFDSEASFAPPPFPEHVALWRARAALAEAGLIEAVNAAVASLGAAALQWWEYGTEVERAHPRIAQLAAALGLTDAQIDDLFRRAAVIEP